MMWLSIIKFLLPVALLAAFGFYEHDAGWKSRDATVTIEKQQIAEATAKDERAACAKDQALTQGVSHDYQAKLKAANDRLAAALGGLYDAHHPQSTASGISGGTSGRNATTYNNGLYYTDERAATAALNLAAIASRQAEQLVACQAFITKERGQ